MGILTSYIVVWPLTWLHGAQRSTWDEDYLQRDDPGWVMTRKKVPEWLFVYSTILCCIHITISFSCLHRISPSERKLNYFTVSLQRSCSTLLKPTPNAGAASSDDEVTMNLLLHPIKTSLMALRLHRFPCKWLFGWERLALRNGEAFGCGSSHIGSEHKQRGAEK